MNPLLAITREDRVDDALARRAAERGFEVLRLALLGTDAGPDGDRFLAWLSDPPRGAAVAWTSRRASEAIAARALPASRDALARLPLFAVGAESAGPLRAAGLTVTTPPAGSERAAQLASLIAGSRAPAGDAMGATPAPTRVAFLHGDRALPDLPEALRAAGIRVEPFEIYRTRFLSPDVRPLERAVSDGRLAAVTFYSPSGVEALERLLRPEAVAAVRKDVLALARGETTYASLAARGYRRGTRPGPSEPFDSFALEALQFHARTPR